MKMDPSQGGIYMYKQNFFQMGANARGMSILRERGVPVVFSPKKF